MYLHKEKSDIITAHIVNLYLKHFFLSNYNHTIIIFDLKIKNSLNPSNDGVFSFVSFSFSSSFGGVTDVAVPGRPRGPGKPLNPRWPRLPGGPGGPGRPLEPAEPGGP